MSTETTDRDPGRRPGELGAVELLRWTWRQLTSMRTALILLFLLALAAIPGSVIPQSDVDALKTSQWQDEHPKLTPIYERLGLFSVYDSAWFSAIYILLMLSLVGCIVPRLRVYLRGMRAQPPKAPRNLLRMPEHTTYAADEPVTDVHARARAVLRKRGYRLRDAEEGDGADGAVAAERGYLREAGNLLFHLSILIVLVGFAVGNLFGYRGGVILIEGNGFANNLTQYDDFVPGSLFDDDWMEPFDFNITEFTAEWFRDGPRAGQAAKFVADLTYRTEPGADPVQYDLRVNHPLTIGDTDIFLIGHGYAPIITIRDGNGDAISGPSIFLPTDSSFRSFGVVRAPDAKPAQVGLKGEFYPTYAFTDETGPFSAFGDLLNPAISMLVYTGDLGMDDGTPQSVYTLDEDTATPVLTEEGTPFRVDLAPGQSVELPNGLGSVSFDGVERWNRIQISRTPGKFVALGGVVLALIGVMMSLFIRPRRIWVRARRDNGTTVVELAGLDRSGSGDIAGELREIVELMGGASAPPEEGDEDR